MVTIEETKALLDVRKGQWVEVAKEAGVGYEWLLKFAKGKINHPGFDKIAKLYTYLKDKEAA